MKQWSAPACWRIRELHKTDARLATRRAFDVLNRRSPPSAIPPVRRVVKRQGVVATMYRLCSGRGLIVKEFYRRSDQMGADARRCRPVFAVLCSNGQRLLLNTGSFGHPRECDGKSFQRCKLYQHCVSQSPICVHPRPSGLICGKTRFAKLHPAIASELRHPTGMQPETRMTPGKAPSIAAKPPFYPRFPEQPADPTGRDAWPDQQPPVLAGARPVSASAD